MGSITSLLGKYPRVAIVEVLSENPDDELSVPEIVEEAGISKRGAYIHVRKLLEEGIIRKSRKEGKCWYYRINENDPRAEILPLLESVFTLGRLEREIKRDQGLAPEEPLPFGPTLVRSRFELGARYEAETRLGTAGNVPSVDLLALTGTESRRLKTENFSPAQPLAAT